MTMHVLNGIATPRGEHVIDFSVQPGLLDMDVLTDIRCRAYELARRIAADPTQPGLSLRLQRMKHEVEFAVRQRRSGPMIPTDNQDMP